MIYQVNARNVNKALSQGLRWLANRGVAEHSRYGDVIVSPCPVITCYNQPTERVLFSPERDANPFFHLMEAIWMLAGRDDIAFPQRFNKRFKEFSDDGEIAPGAYGYRWRKYFGYDQLDAVITELRANPNSRRAHIMMWDPGHGDFYRHEVVFSAGDHGRAMQGTVDVPCNTNIYFRINDGRLDMQVNNRSNDIIWGAYGANAVHMSVLHELLALAVGVGVGRYYQASWNFHAYTNIYPVDRFQAMAEDADLYDLYSGMGLRPMPLLAEGEDWDEFLEQCEAFCDGLHHSCDLNFFEKVLIPMHDVWGFHEEKEYLKAESAASRIVAPDWRRASQEWMARRARKWAAKGAKS